MSHLRRCGNVNDVKLLPDRLMVGHLVLVQGIEVRVLVGQHERIKRFIALFLVLPEERAGSTFVKDSKPD